MEKEHNLTLREHYAGNILSAMVSTSDIDYFELKNETLIKKSIEMADQLIEELNKNIIQPSSPKKSIFNLYDITEEKFEYWSKTSISPIPKINKSIYLWATGTGPGYGWGYKLKEEIGLLRKYWTTPDTESNLEFKKNIAKKLDDDYNGIYSELEYIQLSNEIAAIIKGVKYVK